MGIEYRFNISPESPVDFDSFIRSSPFFQSHDSEHNLYNLGFTSEGAQENRFPAHVSIEDSGIYFCDNLTSKVEASQIFKALIDYALRTSSKVEITEI